MDLFPFVVLIMHTDGIKMVGFQERWRTSRRGITPHRDVPMTNLAYSTIYFNGCARSHHHAGRLLTLPWTRKLRRHTIKQKPKQKVDWVY
jgi:hypothetical protein